MTENFALGLKKFKVFSSLVTNIINTITDLLYINID
jgi:hypothetical protein